MLLLWWLRVSVVTGISAGIWIWFGLAVAVYFVDWFHPMDHVHRLVCCVWIVASNGYVSRLVLEPYSFESVRFRLIVFGPVME